VNTVVVIVVVIVVVVVVNIIIIIITTSTYQVEKPERGERNHDRGKDTGGVPQHSLAERSIHPFHLRHMGCINLTGANPIMVMLMIIITTIISFFSSSIIIV
jgi:hypothetical protein